MEQAVLTGFLAISVALLNPSSVNHIDTTSQQPTNEMRDYQVLEGESIGSISEKVYGNSDYWTTIWNDNNWIKNPDLIEKGWVLKIRNIKPVNKKIIQEELIETAQTIQAPSINPSISPIKAEQTSPILTQPPTQANDQTALTGPLTEIQINFLGNCEAGMDPTRNSGNGYYGAFQFSYGTWKNLNSDYETANLAPLEVQIEAVQKLVARSNIFTQFPACAKRMQAEGIL